MVDYEYWREAYKDTWEKGNEKEQMVKAIIEKHLCTKVEFYGLCAGHTVTVKGSAEMNGFKKGDADLYIPEYNTYVEVTGPMIKVNPNDALWIRPDKVENAINKYDNGNGKYHFIFHVATLKTDETLIRPILIGKHLLNDVSKGLLHIIHPTIRGRQERYIEIPPLHLSVYSLNWFFKLMKLKVIYGNS